ncbi:CPBP family intramembrane glutamic endopeptidase [Ignavibacterium album]|uniref:CPBP family intramembrane glutamic endopeptidase n=1 Tax=Ignavibacterium album TaxID=591197 RepID=UPI0002F4BE5D|nr:CPBP family intramembrane glutamic endopeptidase [Ignavibacterium album]
MLKREIKEFVLTLKDFDRKVVTVFLTVAVLQTFSWYFTSRRFFRENLFEYFLQYKDPYLIEYLYWFWGDFLTFALPTIFIIKFFFKENIADYGFRLGEWRQGFVLSIIFLSIMIPIIWFASSSNDFIQKYPHLSSAKDSWNTLFIYESGMLVYMIGWEFIWRGFMLFGLEKKFGSYAIFIQMIPFVILHNGKPFLETLGSIPGGIALGWLALRTRSFYYCVAVHIGVMYSIDLISIIRFRTNEYGIGIESIFNIIGHIF